MINKFFNFAYALNVFIQSAFSFIFPVGIFIAGAWALVRYCSLDKWVYIPAILIGVICGVYSLFKYAIYATKNMPKVKSRSKTENGAEKNDRKQ